MLLTVNSLRDCLDTVSSLDENQTTLFTVNFPETKTVTVTRKNNKYLVDNDPLSLEDTFQQLAGLAVESFYTRKFVLGTSEYLDSIEIPTETVSVIIESESTQLECVSKANYLKILDTLVSKNGLSVLERNKAAVEHPDVYAGSFMFYTKNRVIEIVGNLTKRF